MKRLAERGGKPSSGYLAPCRRCGLVVVHAESTGKPFHMHRWSALCQRLAIQRGVRQLGRSVR